MKIYLVFIFTTLSAFCGFSQDSYSVESQTRGFSLAADVGISGWTCENYDFQNEKGFSYGLQANYGINHQWIFYLQTHFASIASVFENNENYPFFDASLGTRYYFGSNTIKWRPFLGAHLNYMRLTTTIFDLVTNDPIKMRFKGLAGGLSAGINYYLNSHLSLFGNIQANYGKSISIYFDFNEINENHSFSTLQYGLGISYNFSN